MATEDEKFRQKAKDYKEAFGGPEGLRVLDDLSRQCHEKVTTFKRNEPDTTAFNEGQRDVFLYIKRMIETDLDKSRQEEAISKE